jgi:hypothetical protein
LNSVDRGEHGHRQPRPRSRAHGCSHLSCRRPGALAAAAACCCEDELPAGWQRPAAGAVNAASLGWPAHPLAGQPAAQASVDCRSLPVPQLTMLASPAWRNAPVASCSSSTSSAALPSCRQQASEPSCVAQSQASLGVEVCVANAGGGAQW